MPLFVQRTYLTPPISSLLRDSNNTASRPCTRISRGLTLFMTALA